MPTRLPPKPPCHYPQYTKMTLFRLIQTGACPIWPSSWLTPTETNGYKSLISLLHLTTKQENESVARAVCKYILSSNGVQRQWRCHYFSNLAITIWGYNINPKVPLQPSHIVVIQYNKNRRGSEGVVIWKSGFTLFANSDLSIRNVYTLH